MKNIEYMYKKLCSSLWTYSEINNKYGEILNNGDDHFLAQYRIWAEGYICNGENALDIKKEHINRNLLELFFQSRELVPIKYAAISWAMNEETFRNVLKKANELNYITESELRGEYKNVYRIPLVSSFHRRLKTFRQIGFSDYNSYIDILYRAIKDELKINDIQNPIRCSAITSIKEQDYAITFDSLTNEPIGLKFQVYLDTKKPIDLIPDKCSIHTYNKNKEFLEDKILGKIDFELSEL